MKRKLFVFSLPLLTMALAGCGEPASSSASSASQEPPTPAQSSSKDATYSGDLPEFDPSGVRDSFIIHYHRTDARYDNYALWIWDHGNGGEGAEYLPCAVDSYGSVSYYPLSTWSPGNWSKLDLGIIVKSKGDWSEKDPDGDRYVVMSELTMDDNGNYSVWLWTGITAIYTTEVEFPYFVSRAYFKDFNTLVVTSGNGSIKTVELYRDGEKIQTYGPLTEGTRKMITVPLESKADMAHTYKVKAIYDNDFAIEQPVDVASLYETAEFAEKYNYLSEDLGATYTKEKTTFKVWSPFSTAIKLRIYDSGTPVALDAEGSDEHVERDMTQGEKGVWSAEVSGDLAGKYYTFVVSNHKYKNKEIVDPYAKSAGINGVRGMIVDFDATDPEGWGSFDKAIEVDPKALTVYETHVADVTNHETWKGTESRRGKFLGMTEEGTVLKVGEKTVKTGFDHIKELGVNAVQLQPMFDHANDERPDKYKFNWGYNPLNYNVIEGSYSSDPYDGYARIREFKSLVKAYHDAGINVIMDVVYNHVNSVEGQNFDVLAPGYFFRYNSQGGLSNGSGCGNETASDRVMFRKFMIDSVNFWAKEYKLGGFRFDLMALHDMDTMKALAAELHAINPTLAVYGEPWTGGSTPLAESKQASQANGLKFEGYAQFNDAMRDTLVKSGMKPIKDLGFGFNKWTKPGIADLNGVSYGLKGFTGLTVPDSEKTINYVSCHDNFTINDRIVAYDDAMKAEVGYVPTTLAEREKMNLFSQSFALLSQGTSFMLAGEEMLRSKYEQTPENLTVKERLDYAHNSYNSTEAIDGGVVNAIDYGRKIDHPELFRAYKEMIKIKQTVEGLHQGIHKLADDDNSKLITVTFSKTNDQVFNSFKSGNYEYKIVYNAGFGDLPLVDLAGYELVFDSLARNQALTSATPMSNFEVVVARKAA